MDGYEHNRLFVLNVSTVQGALVGMLFFLLGFNLAKLYFPVFLIALFYVVYKERGVRLSINYLIFLILVFLGMILPFLVGYKVMPVERPEVLFVVWVFNLIFVSYLFFRLDLYLRIIAILFYSLGLFSESILVVAFSYYSSLAGEYYGYGKLLHPISGMLINSPGVSNSLVPFTVILLYRLFFYNFNLSWLLSFLLLAFSIAAASFLGGRAFFVCLFVALLVFLTFSSIGKKILILLAIVIALVFFTTYSDLELFAGVLSRFESGLESTRFEHYASGLSQLANRPFGGFNVDQNIESTFWFHNIFLDNAKYSGWITFLALFFLFLFFGLKLLANHRHPYFIILFCLYIVTFLLHQQDVVLEGNFRLFMVTMLCGLTVLSKSRDCFYENKRNYSHL